MHALTPIARFVEHILRSLATKLTHSLSTKPQKPMATMCFRLEFVEHLIQFVEPGDRESHYKLLM